ncbi:hypothetical protein G4B88_001056 [Cannabis sativa]|uniref:Uncharacterized protein n=1 Tax=Cannabis sativa TaxID=3483 RepID=A0A7J6DPJ3_CANSA|nr:hypothetical protein G4B88_001056 [Cannabis sativa]
MGRIREVERSSYPRSSGSQPSYNGYNFGSYFPPYNSDKRQPPKVKAFLAVISGMTALVLLRFIVHDHDNLFVAAEAVHSIGISVLIYKLMKEKTCAGFRLVKIVRQDLGEPNFRNH